MNKEKNYTCPLTGLPVNTILLGVLLVGGAALGTCAYMKLSTINKNVNQIHSLMVTSQFGSETTFDSFINLMTNEKVIKDKEEQVKQQISTMRDELGITETSENADENAPALPSIDTSKANADARFEANATEAKTLFGLEGTPGNAVINKKTGVYLAIGGAYPNPGFKDMVMAVKEGKDLSSYVNGDSITQGKIKNDDLENLFKGAHFYGKDTADVVIVEYSDLLCPFCKRHYNAKTIESIVDEDASIALVFKNHPIVQIPGHETSAIGSRGVECAGELGGSEAFYKYLGLAFTYKSFNATNVVKIAQDAGLDVNAFQACFNK